MGAKRTRGMAHGYESAPEEKSHDYGTMVVDLAPLAGVKRSGIYALSVPCMKEPRMIKIGKAKDLRARINQYQLYYPFGVALELLWIFPKNTRDVDSRLQEMERFIHKQLDHVHTTARRRQTEWFWNSKGEVVDAFLRGAEIFAEGTLVNPAFRFSVPDLTAQEKKDNAKAKKETARLAQAQADLIRENFPRDYAFLCSCSQWETDREQTFPCPM